nr:TlpA disulfide reductase family protein [Anaerolineae bacterium]
DGQAVSLSDYAGQIILLNFWATWCTSCLTEMPAYEQVYQAYQPDLVVLAINLQESVPEVQQYAAGLGLSFPVLLDRQGLVTNQQYQVTGMPGSFIIDRQGQIYYRHLGPMSADTLTTKLAELGL